MVDKYLIPRASAPFVDAAGHPTREWYNWLRALDVLFASSDANVQAEIEAIARALGSPDGSVEKIPPQDNAEVGKVIGINSVATYGVLPNVVQVQLLGDVATADPTSYYGSDDVGNKGWHPMVDAFATTTLELTSNDDTGVVSFDLADLADTGTGTFKLITRDTKGRVSGMADGTTDDVPEGSTNLYFTAPRAQAAVVASGITEGDTTHSPSGDAVFDALALKADASDLDAHEADTDNPHEVTAEQVGLGNVNNTSDADKPVSTAQQTALDLKYDKTGGDLSGNMRVVKATGVEAQFELDSGDALARHFYRDTDFNYGMYLTGADGLTKTRFRFDGTNMSVETPDLKFAGGLLLEASGLLDTSPTISDLDALGGGVSRFFSASGGSTGIPSAVSTAGGCGHYVAFNVTNGSMTWHSLGPNRLFVRTYNSGSWAAWKEVGLS